MDIIDVLVSRALTPQVQIEAAAAQATKAVTDANAAVAAAESAEEKTEAAYEDLQTALTILDAEISFALDEKLALLDFAKNVTTTEASSTVDLSITLTNVIAETISSVVKYYNSTGQNTDGTMTQKAISDALDALESKIESVDLGQANAGKIVVVGNDGYIMSGSTTEEAIIMALMKDQDFEIKGAVGLQVDYKNKTCIRTQEAKNYNQGSDFNKYDMYGGRMKCNIADNGAITAFYGDNNYTEDGSNGQVMIYQPKFYYSRVIIDSKDAGVGKIVQKEVYILSDKPETGFKLHPIFIAKNGDELDYVLLGAYEGSAYSVSGSTYDETDSANVNFVTDKLSSIANVKPISGVNKSFTPANAEQMARNRGTGWHVTNLAAISATQMLAMVEFGSLNSQECVELGVSNITNNTSANCSSYTGSTAALGNGTGHADSTVNETAGVFNTYTTDGYRAICYRGMENVWGNIWKVIAGVNVVGNGNQMGGMPYICKNFNYSPTENTADYEALGFYLPSPYDWISAMGYGDSKYDWVIMPAECIGANSHAPVGDNLWTIPTMNGVNMLSVGGQWYADRNNGMFYYAADQAANTAARSISARLMFIPTKNSTYTANIAAWTAKRGA